MTLNPYNALGSEMFTKFDLRQLIRPWIIPFLCWYVMSHCDIGLWPLDLKVRVTRDWSSVTWSKSVWNLREIAQSSAVLLIILGIFTARPLDYFCLSVRPSVTFRCFVQKNEDTSMRFSASGRTIILVSGEVEFIQIFTGDRPQRRHYS